MLLPLALYMYSRLLGTKLRPHLRTEGRPQQSRQRALTPVGFNMKTLKRLIRPGVWGAFAVALIMALAACGDAPEDTPPIARPTPPAATATLTVIEVPSPQATSTSISTATPFSASPSNTVPAAPSPTPTNPDAERLAAKGMEILTKFTDEYSPRESGSDGELAAAVFIKGYMEELGFDAKFQQFEVEHLFWSEEFVSLVGDNRPNLRAVPLARTGYGEASGPLVPVGKAFEDDIPEGGLKGAVALIERGEITFEEKVNRVANAGAVAAIIYNNERGIFRGSLQSNGPIPVASLSLEQGNQVLELLEDEPELEARVKIQTTLLDSQNVIAELNNQAAECGVVVIGGHYDSVADTQAAGDNGTGVASLLVMAEELANAHYDEERPLPYAVRFIFFGVEEIGLLGSRYYVDELSSEERQSIIAMLNFDAMGKGDASVQGSSELTEIAATLALENHIVLKKMPSAEGFGSDHASFMNADVPALFFFGDDFSLINSPDDVLEEVEPSIMGAHIVVGLGLLQEFECKPQS